MKLCSKDFSQKPIQYMVAPSDSNAAVVEFVGSGQHPPLLQSSHLDDRFNGLMVFAIEESVSFFTMT